MRCGFGKLFSGSQNAFSPLRISAWIVPRPSLASGAFKCCELRWSDSPIASLLPGNNMKMKVRRFLTAVNTVVLKCENSKWPVRIHQGLRNAFCGVSHIAALFICKVKQGRDMTPCYHAALTRFELPGVQYRKRTVGLGYNGPPFFAASHSFAEIAGISYRKLNQIHSGIPFKHLHKSCSNRGYLARQARFHCTGRLLKADKHTTCPKDYRRWWPQAGDCSVGIQVTRSIRTTLTRRLISPVRSPQSAPDQHRQETQGASNAS